MQHVCGGFEIPLHQMVMMLSIFCCMDFIPPSVGCATFLDISSKDSKILQGTCGQPVEGA